MLVKIRKLFEISLLKTLRVNFHYFVLRDALRLPILISHNCRLRRVKGSVSIVGPLRPGMMQFGFDTLGLADRGRDRAVWECEGEIVIHGNAMFGAGTKMIVLCGGKLTINQGVAVTGLSSVIVAKEISIGRDCLISWDVLIMDTDFHKVLDGDGCITNQDVPILIGDHTWIGCRCLILKGTVIPSHSIIAAGSNVLSRLSVHYAIYGGSPARLIKTNVSWTK